MSEATENTTDTTESASPQSSEDKFFGVTTQITKSAEDKKADNGQGDLEFEIVEEGQDESAIPAEVKASDDSDVSEDELENYSERVQKRINKLRYETHEESRKKEAAEQMRDEAVKVAKQLADKNREYESLIQRGESALISQIKERAEMAVDSATSEYRTAYEQGDTDKIIESQKSLIKAQTELTEATRHESQIAPAQNGQQAAQLTPEQLAYHQQQQQQQQQQQRQQQPPNPRAVAWGKENPWFEDQSSDQAKLMTSLAYGLHRVAVMDKGIAPNTNAYFDFINAGMRERFTDYEWPDQGGVRQTTASTASQPSSVVAPSARNNGARPRKVKLTPTQRALAKRIGLTQEQLANQILKEREMSHG